MAELMICPGCGATDCTPATCPAHVSQSGDPVEQMLCRWAEARYGLANVVRVTFEPDSHGPYSDVTPDVDPYVRVEVYVEGQERPAKTGEWEQYGTDLIRDILRFANRRRVMGQQGDSSVVLTYFDRIERRHKREVFTDADAAYERYKALARSAFASVIRLRRA